MWVVASMLLIFAAFFYISSFFPKLNLRWGGPAGRPLSNRVLISPKGRIVFGILFSYLGITFFTGISASIFGYLQMLVLAAILIVLYCFYLQDKDNFISPSSFDER